MPASAPTPQTPEDSAVRQRATVSTLAEVEELLDLVEREGGRDQELIVLGPNAFLVRWR